ncbi:MAG: MGMT family protein [Eubacterium sp.]|jgi:methylated-DNA-protein-cysteine methyltransferase-like protein|nr:MGMT family protein [Eubacterium sp.]
MIFYDLVFNAVRQIPVGKVASYGDIAFYIGRPRAARMVGRILHKNKEPVFTPCHRVVFKNGSLTSGYAFGGIGEQKRLLEAEGVEFLIDGRVDMKKCRYIIKYTAEDNK